MYVLKRRSVKHHATEKMKYNTEFIQQFMAEYNYPAEAVDAFTKVLTRLDEEAAFRTDFIEATKDYTVPEPLCRLGEALDKLTPVAEKYGINEYTLHFVFLLTLTEKLKEVYIERGLSLTVYHDTMDDLRCKLIECIKCEEVPGTFVGGWFDGFFRMARFAYGRFQYEIAPIDLNFEYTAKCGKVLKKGDPAIGFHIPSSGIPLTDEVRLDSYKKAYEAYKHLFPDGLVVFRCGSWLLYPKHREFLPEKSNILRFMDDFETVCWEEKKGFPNGWRVFDKYSDLPYNELPRDTSLRRAYADWLESGHNGGDAYCVIIFDGEKIVR